MNGAKDLQSYTIAVRAYAVKAEGKNGAKEWVQNPSIGHSEWALILDTETTTDPTQKLRFGSFQLRQHGLLEEEGFFYDPKTLTRKEIQTLQDYAESKEITLLTVGEFVEEVFFHYVCDLSALCIGFNLPFDLSRLAISQTTAKNWRGAFSFAMSKNSDRPRVRVKHLNRRASLIEFTKPRSQPIPQSYRKADLEIPPHRGYFLDVKTLTSALLSGSWSLKSLADHLKTDSRKIDTDEHGASLTPEYLDYAARDVQVTWECFEKLRGQYESYGLRQTPVNRIYSEASRGKANFREMEIKGWRELQPEFPPELTGAIMSAYYGGRAEVHIRRQIARVLYCDFLSMYPTVCTLMGLWRFVVAEKTLWEDSTAETQAFLESVRLEDLQKQETWAQLATIVQIQTMNDVLPVRAKYDGKQYSTGLNHLNGDSPMWYTLADCIASKLLTGGVPKVIQAIRFQPRGVQKGLLPINIAGNPAYRIDPYKDDFYRRLIELRNEVKAKIKECESDEKERLEADQLALKICANATSYGIFVELNEGNSSERQKVTIYGQTEKPFTTSVMRTEEPGKYFHPLIATLITGAARLMLAIAERLAKDSGITWAFCDTDSMALAKPHDVKMSDTEFLKRAEKVREWFSPLNPYRGNEPLFKIEDVNFKLSDGKESTEIEKLFCFAVSSKRYALFNIDDSNKPIIRKASAHGLGHLLPPYEEKDAPANIPKPVIKLTKIGVTRWQYDFWYQIITAALSGDPAQVNLADLPSFNNVAVSRYAATSPDLLRWFKNYNANREYSEQVKPFNFLLSFFAKSKKQGLTPIAPYDADHSKALQKCFDRNTGGPIQPEDLKTYLETLAQYHLHPEAKFDNGDYMDIGVTKRKRIYASGIEHIGKEANRLEDQFYLGHDPEAQTVYRLPKKDFNKLAAVTIRESRKYRQRELARASGFSPRHVSRLISGKVAATPQSIARLQAAINDLEKEKKETAETLSNAKQAIQKNKIGLRKFAAQAGIDPANLHNALTEKRPVSAEMLAKLQSALMKIDD